MFLVGLFFLIVGNGCFKPNLATQVGGLYPPGDPRLDRAYSIYYMGVNLGTLFSHREHAVRWGKTTAGRTDFRRGRQWAWSAGSSFICGARSFWPKII